MNGKKRLPGAVLAYGMNKDNGLCHLEYQGGVPDYYVTAGLLRYAGISS